MPLFLYYYLKILVMINYFTFIREVIVVSLINKGYKYIFKKNCGASAPFFSFQHLVLRFIVGGV